MSHLLATKGSIKKAYIAALQSLYPFYTEGSRPLKLAHEAADAALAGQYKLKGAAWSQALEMHGLNDRATMRVLAELPE